jgi:hypothetical protein
LGSFLVVCRSPANLKMIFEISSSFESKVNEAAWLPYVPAVENLINAHLNRYHFFVPTRSTAEVLAELPCFSYRQTAVLRSGILSNYSTLAARARTADRTILLIDDGESMRPSRENQKVMWLRQLQDNGFCAEAQLLVENAQTDGAFLQAIIKTLARDVDYAEIPALHFGMGGGSPLADCYEQNMLSSRPTFCIADSDRDYPGGPLGNTARRLQRVIGSAKAPTTAAHILTVREMENFIPTPVIRDIYENNPTVQARLDIYERIEHASKSPHSTKGMEYNRFVDMKEGLSKDIIKANQGGREFFERLWRVAIPVESEFDVDAPPAIVFAGISRNLVKEATSFLEERPMNRGRMRASVRELCCFEELIALVRSILAFSAAPMRQRV